MLNKKLIKDLGNLQMLHLDIDQPIKMKVDLTMQSINLYVGKNGSGKSLILKIIWALSTIMVFKVNKKCSDIELEQVAQYVWDNTFEDNNFTGAIKAIHIGGNIGINLRDGKVILISVNIAESIKECSTPIFMSTTMRTFEEIERYFKLQDKIGIDSIPEYYKLYDSIYANKIKDQFEKIIFVDEKLEESIKKFEMDKYGIKEFFLKDEKFMYLNDKGEEKQMASFSKGEQSLLNMMLGAK